MWWHVLGVERHADIDAIKQAYSALIKEFRPEAHPEKFSEIRQAFEQARKQVARAKQPTEYVEQPQVTAEPIISAEPLANQPAVRVKVEEYQPPITSQPVATTEPHQTEESIIDLLERWKKGRFRDAHCIDKVLDHSSTHDFFALQNASLEVFAWLIENVKPASGLLATTINMPVKELARLNSLFGWSLRERNLYQHFDTRDLSLIFYGIASGQSARLHVNPIVKQKAESKQKSSNALLEKIIQWGTGIILVYMFIMIIGLFIASLTKDKYALAGLWCVVFYVLIDGLYYSFAGLRKAGILRTSVLTPRVKMWALGIRQLLMGVIALGVILALEAIVLGILYWTGSAVTKDNFVFMLTILLPVTYLTYWLNKEIFLFSRLRYYQLIREFERIRLNSR